VQIVGVSFDDPSENAGWALREGFEFELWSDVDQDLAVYYGAASLGDPLADRKTFLLDADGTLVLEYTGALVVSLHPADVLADCTALFGP